MKFKKIIAGVMGAVMAASCVPMSVNSSLISSTSASAETSGTCGENVNWLLSDDGVLTISGTGDMSNYYDDGSPFHNITYIKSVNIENGVTSIGDRAFEYCRNLTSIEIPNSVASIGDFAFDDCRSLTSIEIPNTVTSIGGSAFYGTKWLENKQAENPFVIVNGILINGETCTGDVVIPDTVTSIGYGAFDDCSSLTSIEIPDTVTSIGFGAFSDCSSLKSIEIPDSVTSIDGYAFSGCYGLTDVYYTGTSDEWNKIDIGEENDKLISSKIHFETTRKDEPTKPTTTTPAENPTTTTTTTITTTTTTPTEKTSLGDLNNDGKIDSKDAVMVLKDYAQALATGGGAGNPTGDVNKDGKEDSKDAVLILRYYASVLAKIYTGSIENFK